MGMDRRRGRVVRSGRGVEGVEWYTSFMIGKPPQKMGERQRTEKLAAAKDEAADLREIERLRREKGVPYAKGMKRVGRVLPHSTFRRRRKRLKLSGEEGLLDRRHAPPTRLTPQIRGFIEGAGRTDPGLSVESIIKLVSQQFKLEDDFKPRTIEAVLQRAGLARPQVRFTSQVQPATLRAAANPPVEEPLAAAGMMWLTVGDDLVGYTLGQAEAIQELTQEVPPPTPVTPEEREHRDDEGRFLPTYNAPQERKDPEVGAKFESVDVKRVDKDLGRMKIVGCRLETLRAKLLALMALPMVTDCGHFDGATDVRGTYLAGLGGIDYMPATLDKFARELKYLDAAGAMQQRHAQIWYRVTSTWGGKEVCCSILYVDTTTKELWTAHFHKSGRVAMLGRVMPCVDTVLINQGAGVPLWIQTYSGHVALVKNVLPQIDALEAAIGEGMLGRLTVLDGEMDSVALFKEFDLRDRYFIAPLDSSRVKGLNSIEGLRHLDPYRDGDWIGGGYLLLNDSLDRKAPPYRCRVIVLQRRTKETTTVFGTNAPPKPFTNKFLLDTFFARWPKQEGVFRQLNSVAAFKSTNGYGKQRVLNITVIDEMTKLSAQLEGLSVRHQAVHERSARTAADLHKREVELRRATRTLDSVKRSRDALRQAGKTKTIAYSRQGERKLAAQSEYDRLKPIVAEAKRRNETALEKEAATDKQITQKREKKSLLESMREIFQTDVGLDLILSILKTGFLLVLQYVLRTFFGGMKIDLLTFANHILLLPGVRIRTDTTETIRFYAHRRNPEMMAALEKACDLFNALRHHHDGRLIRFEVFWPPGPKDHAT